MEFEKLGIMLLDTGKIAFVVGLLIYLIRKVLSKKQLSLLNERPHITNAFVILSSVALSFLGNWLNTFTFKSREIVELIYFGLFSAGMNTLGYEFIKNWAKVVIKRETE